MYVLTLYFYLSSRVIASISTFSISSETVALCSSRARRDASREHPTYASSDTFLGIIQISISYTEYVLEEKAKGCESFVLSENATRDGGVPYGPKVVVSRPNCSVLNENIDSTHRVVCSKMRGKFTKKRSHFENWTFRACGCQI